MKSVCSGKASCVIHMSTLWEVKGRYRQICYFIFKELKSNIINKIRANRYRVAKWATIATALNAKFNYTTSSVEHYWCILKVKIIHNTFTVLLVTYIFQNIHQSNPLMPDNIHEGIFISASQAYGFHHIESQTLQATCKYQHMHVLFQAIQLFVLKTYWGTLNQNFGTLHQTTWTLTV